MDNHKPEKMRPYSPSPLILPSVVATVVMIIIWGFVFSPTPLGFRPLNSGLHTTLDNLVFCADMPMCFRVGSSLIFAPVSEVLQLAEYFFGTTDVVRLSAAKLMMMGLFSLIAFGFLNAGRLWVQTLFLTLFTLSPLFYSAVGLIHYDITTLAFWSILFMAAQRVMELEQKHRFLLIIAGGMIFENNGAIVAFMFWALDLRKLVLGTHWNLTSLSQTAFKSGVKYLGVAISVPLSIFIISYLKSGGDVFFLQTGGTLADLYTTYGANNHILFTLSKIGEVTGFALLLMVIILIILRLRSKEYSLPPMLILRHSERSFIILCCLVGFIMTIGVGQFTSGIKWEWPRQFLPLSFMTYFFAASMVNDALNRKS